MNLGGWGLAGGGRRCYLRVEGAAAAEDDEVHGVAALGEALGDGEGLLFGATVAEVVLEEDDVERRGFDRVGRFGGWEALGKDLCGDFALACNR